MWSRSAGEARWSHFHRFGYFRQWVPETSGLWVTEAVMGFDIHHGVRNTPWGENCITGGRVTEVVMGFELHHGVRNTPRGEKCYLGGGGVKEAVCVCVCVCVLCTLMR